MGVRAIQRRKYLNEWRQQNDDSLATMRKLLAHPSKSRWHFLKIISILRFAQKSIAKRRYKRLLNRFFYRNRSVILFVLMSSWRTLAAQQNIAAFNIIKIIEKNDKMKITQTIAKWHKWTKQRKMQRLEGLDVAKKFDVANRKKQSFKHWLNAFVHVANTKIALFFWCHSVENRVFNHWKNWMHRSLRSKMKADKMCKRNVFKRYF